MERPMPTKRPGNLAKKAPQRSRKGVADRGAKDKYREEEKQDRQRQRQNEADRPDRGGPQGRKDKDLQRKF
jgi:hypothetical protein